MLQNWRRLEWIVKDFLSANCAVFETPRLTNQVFDHIRGCIAELAEKLNVQNLLNHGQQKNENCVWIVGEIHAMEKLKAVVEREIETKKAKIQEDLSVTSRIIPFFPPHVIDYIHKMGIFSELPTTVRNVVTDKKKKQLTIEATPAGFEDVQSQVMALVNNLEDTRCQENKKKLFMKVLRTQPAIEGLEKALADNRVVAVWTHDERTVSMHSESKENSQQAMICLNQVIWEGHYPTTRPLDELERSLLSDPKWSDKKAEMESAVSPLFIEENRVSHQIDFAGLTKHRNHVLEEVKGFFDQNLIKKEVFVGKGKRVTFLWTFKYEAAIEYIQREFQVDVIRQPESEMLEISGTSNGIANAKRFLKTEHENVKKDLHQVENPARVQYINDYPDILSDVATKNHCVVCIHDDEDNSESEETATMLDFDTANFHVRLPFNKTVCVVQRGDITKVQSCDVIVNAANANLDHIGGLARVIVNAG